MARLFSELAFSPSLSEIIEPGSRGRIVVFTGGNNSGKSAYLKKAIEDASKLYIGVNRFYSFHHLGLYTKNDSEIHEWYSNMQSQARSAQFQNFEHSFFNCSTAISRLTNERRKVLFEKFEQLFGTKVEVLAEDEENVFSNRYISVGGDSLSVTSSGTRLFLGILAALMDDRFSTVAIDEPELGLSPALQRRLADIILRGEHKSELLPHNPNIILSTHSHIFLDRETPQNNYIVEKTGNLITARKCQDFHEIHDVQFRLLGNDLSQLFLPDAVIFVEGVTDQLFLETVLRIHIPNIKVIIQACGGDIAKRLSYWTQTLGDMQLSPYRARTFVVYDEVKQAGLERACAGLPDRSLIEWDKNGIEYLYPDDVLQRIFRSPKLIASELTIDGDAVSHNSITYKKMELCRKVCAEMNTATQLSGELHTKFLDPIRELA